MSEINRAVRGTMDVVPADSYKWQYIERIIADTAKLYGYSEIRIPVFEYTEVFRRSVGETTDVVQKEMYTFDDMGGRSITLRPEGTAGVCIMNRCRRSCIIYYPATGMKSRSPAGSANFTSLAVNASAQLFRVPMQRL